MTLNILSISGFSSRPVFLNLRGGLPTIRCPWPVKIVAHEQFSLFAGKEIENYLSRWQNGKNRPLNVLITPGNTMVGVLSYLAGSNQINWQKIKVWSPGEFVGINPESSLSLNGYLKRHFIDLMPKQNNFPPENFQIFDAEKTNPTQYLELLQNSGGLDVAILGIGLLGEVAFNLPGTSFESSMEMVKLTREIIRSKGLDHATFQIEEPSFGYYVWRIGMGDLLKTKHIFLLARGEEKREIVYKALFGPLTTSCPASVLRYHQDFKLIVSHEVLGILPYRETNENDINFLLRAVKSFRKKLGTERAREVINKYLGFILTRKQFLKVLQNLKIGQITSKNVETIIEKEILNFYEENIAEILNSVSDSEGIEALHQLFIKGVRVYQLPGVRSEVIRRKKILFEYLLSSLRSEEILLGSQERSSLALKLLLEEILSSVDHHIYMPALEAIIEVLAYEKLVGGEFFKKSFKKLIESSKSLPRFGWRLVDLLQLAKNKRVQLFKLNRESFAKLASEVIFEIIADSPEVIKEMLEYLTAPQYLDSKISPTTEIIKKLKELQNKT